MRHTTSNAIVQNAKAFTQLRLIGRLQSAFAPYHRVDGCHAPSADEIVLQAFDGVAWSDIKVYDAYMPLEELADMALTAYRMGLPLTLDHSLGLD